MTVAEYISREYFNDPTMMGVLEVRKLLSFKHVHVQGSIDKGLAVWIAVNEDGLLKAREALKTKDYGPKLILHMLRNPGNNALYFICLAKGLKTLRQMIRDAFANPEIESISWVDEDVNKLQYFRRR